MSDTDKALRQRNKAQAKLIDFGTRSGERHKSRRRVARWHKPSMTVRLAIYERDEYRCVACGVEVTPATRTLDHRIPKSKGGTNAESNLQTMCRPCNREKADTLPGGE